MNRTTIEWVRNPDGSQGYTFNPITGCLGPKGDGVHCPYCYARKLANGRLRERYLANTNIATSWETGGGGFDTEITAHNDPFYPRFWPERLNELGFAHRGASKPKGIFPCDMSDLFGIGIPEDWTREVLRVIKQNNHYRFYLLTKQPQNLIKFSPFPDNCWVGVTATSFKMFATACDELEHIKAKVKYISFEPLLDMEIGGPNLNFWLIEAGISWLIIGAQTKPYKPPKIEWVEEIVRAADKAGIPVFLKDNLKPLLEKEDPSECYNGVLGRWQTDGNGGLVFRLRLRQELPG